MTAASYQYRIYVKLIHSIFYLLCLCVTAQESFFLFFFLLSFLDMSAAAQHHIFPTQTPNHPTGINYPAKAARCCAQSQQHSSGGRGAFRGTQAVIANEWQSRRHS